MNFHKDGTVPTDGSIWVFGSNYAGRHGAGAALVARRKFAAIEGVGHGPMICSRDDRCQHKSRCYAIPTKDGDIVTMPLAQIRPYVSLFLEFAAAMTHERFFVTRVGCGLAGYKDAQMAPLFAGAPSNCSFASQWEKYLVADDEPLFL